MLSPNPDIGKHGLPVAGPLLRRICDLIETNYGTRDGFHCLTFLRLSEDWQKLQSGYSSVTRRADNTRRAVFVRRIRLFLSECRNFSHLCIERHAMRRVKKSVNLKTAQRGFALWEGFNTASLGTE